MAATVQQASASSVSQAMIETALRWIQREQMESAWQMRQGLPRLWSRENGGVRKTWLS
jgi:hypothetical protein